MPLIPISRPLEMANAMRVSGDVLGAAAAESAASFSLRPTKREYEPARLERSRRNIPGMQEYLFASGDRGSFVSRNLY